MRNSASVSNQCKMSEQRINTQKRWDQLQQQQRQLQPEQQRCERRTSMASIRIFIIILLTIHDTHTYTKQNKTKTAAAVKFSSIFSSSRCVYISQSCRDLIHSSFITVSDSHLQLMQLEMKNDKNENFKFAVKIYMYKIMSD